MNKPIIGVFREKRDIEEFVFKSAVYMQAYHELYDAIARKGAQVAILMGQGSYLGEGRFAQHWVQVKTDDGYQFEKREEIRVDAVYDKDGFISDGKVLVLNSIQMRDICHDKHASYELLEEFHPKSVIVHDAKELDDALAMMPGGKIAVKGLQGNSGTAVFVGDKTDAHAEEDILRYPVQVQEFIETAGGVPGIVEGRHDFRVVLMNGEPVVATYRTPPEGGLKSNIGFGGVSKLVPHAKIPAELREICTEIDKKLAPISTYRFYSADFGLTAYGWRLFEINSMPGVLAKERGSEAAYYQEKLTDFLIQVAKAGQKGLLQ
jgi:glutathione synthase/RimK-type ligase-like ATP-grasp enzyme